MLIQYSKPMFHRCIPSFYQYKYISYSLNFCFNGSITCLSAPTSRISGELLYGALSLATSAYSSRLMGFL